MKTFGRRRPFARARDRVKATAKQTSGRTGIWALIAGSVVAAGAVVSLLSAQSVARGEERTEQQSFEASAFQIGSSLRVSIQHEEDLVVSAGAFLAANPHVTTGELAFWMTSVRAEERYPELEGLSVMALVHDDELGAFAERLRADPAVPLGPTNVLSVVPPGVRPFYCLIQAVVGFDQSEAASPFGVDYCAGAFGPLVLAARDSGLPSYLAVPDDAGDLLLVQSPIYRGGVIPADVASRREAYVGNLATSVSADILFARVLSDHPDEVITLTYDDNSSVAEFSSRDLPADPQSVVEQFGGGWRATISRAAPAHGVLASDSAMRLLTVGIIANILLGILIYALGTGRRRALRLVGRRTDELRHQALHDALTGLPNRTLILDRVDQLLARCRRNGTVGAALYVDLDGFKIVNDTLGHEVGDQLLRAVTARLTTSLRDVDTIGRMSGDEFVVLVDSGSLEAAPELVAERLLDVLRQPYVLDPAQRPVMITASVGIATGDRDAAGDLLRDADLALYSAKAAGRDAAQLFRPDMESAMQHRFEVDTDLRTALIRDQFRLFYQPIYDLSDLSIVGAEALIRWEHPTRGLLQPDEFIPFLESSGHIVEVGRWILLTACQQAKRWQDQGRDLTVSVNVSARELDLDSIVSHVADALMTTGLDASRLILEITETALMKDTDLTARRLGSLKELGVQLAIDDFGTGYSSLAYLQHFPVDSLKIDRTFIESIARTAESDALIHTLVRLGKDLGLKTLAEGIETTEQLDHLRAVDVDQAQGFLLARPLSADDFESQLLLITPTTATTP